MYLVAKKVGHETIMQYISMGMIKEVFNAARALNAVCMKELLENDILFNRTRTKKMCSYQS